jgi:hypothetical protein
MMKRKTNYLLIITIALIPFALHTKRHPTSHPTAPCTIARASTAPAASEAAPRNLRELTQQLEASAGKGPSSCGGL